MGMSIDKYVVPPHFGPAMAKRLSDMLDERGIKHLTNFNHHNDVESITYWIVDDSGGVEEGNMTPKSLIAEQDWMELDII